MKTQIRSIGTLSLRDALKADAAAGTSALLATVLAEHGVRFTAQAHCWPAADEVDAELRRAVAYRHGCAFIDDTYLAGCDGDIDLVRCARSYDFCQATVAYHVMTSKKKLTKNERGYATLVAARVVAARAAAMFGAKAAHILAVVEAFDSMGVTARLPSLELRTARNEKEAAVEAAILSVINESCDRIDEAPVASPTIIPAVKPTARQVPYLRLVR